MGIMNDDICPFCLLDRTRIIREEERAVALWDRFPVSPGHVLIVPTRHVASWFETTPRERGDMLALIHAAKQEIEKEHSPDGYNIGINDGEAAGQTVFHLHVHVIPRYRGDVKDPRGGVRWVVPEKVRYWGE